MKLLSYKVNNSFLFCIFAENNEKQRTKIHQIMKGQPNFTIVYVFGPEQCEEKYFNDEILSREAGEWVKIGETGYKGDIETITDEILRKEALSRIRQESRTGIPLYAGKNLQTVNGNEYWTYNGDKLTSLRKN